MKEPTDNKKPSGRGKKKSKLLAAAAVFALGIAVASVMPSLQTAAPVHADTSFSTAQVTAIEGILQAYLMEHPEILVDALEVQRNRMELADEEATLGKLAALRDKLENDNMSYVAGNQEGDVTLVEFFDYRCPYCKRAVPALKELLESDPKIRVVYKEFPILGADSVLAARAALASKKQGKYEAFHNALMTNTGSLTHDNIMRIAQKVGIDPAKLLRDMTDPEINKVIADNRVIARELELSGTPAFIVGDAIIPGLADYAQLVRLVDDAREKCVTC
jgi:protein-disulfide isomerase